MANERTNQAATSHVLAICDTHRHVESQTSGIFHTPLHFIRRKDIMVVKYSPAMKSQTPLELRFYHTKWNLLTIWISKV